MSRVYDLRAIALLDETRIARGISEIADRAEPWGGGMMCAGPAGSSLNYAAGVGFDGPISRDDVRRLIGFYESRGVEPRIEFAPFADRSLLDVLEAERFTLRHLENTFFRPLDDGAPIESPMGWPEGLVIERVDGNNPAQVAEFARTAVGGFFPEGTEPPEPHVEMASRVTRHAHSISFLARFEGDARAAGAGALEVRGDVAGLFGVSVRHDLRRRGVQLALLQARLEEARRRGARYATIGSRPGVPTERNAMRFGFMLAYTRAVMVRPGDGLARVIE